MKIEGLAGYKGFRSVCLFAVCVVFIFSHKAAADPGVSVSEVALGMCNALSGPAAAVASSIPPGAVRRLRGST